MIPEYGGHMALELPDTGEFYGDGFYCVRRYNSGRSAICVAVIDSGAKRVWIPVYYCNSVEKAIRQSIGPKIKICHYNIDSDFYPKNVDLRDGDIVIWSNYYGLFDHAKARSIKDCFNSVIFDNAQAFFMAPISGSYNVYSCRKFFGVNDGAYLISDCFKNEETDYHPSKTIDSFMHLLIPYETNTNDAYDLSMQNEKRIEEEGVCLMSRLTRRIMSAIDYKMVMSKRKNNYLCLHQLLKKINRFPIDCTINDTVPLVYPLLIKDDNLRNLLISKHIYVSQWWPDIVDSMEASEWEKELSTYLFPLHIDQRYTIDDMKELSSIILKYI